MSEKLLLLDRKRERIYHDLDRHLVEIESIGEDLLMVNEVAVKNKIQRTMIGKMALQGLGVRYLGIDDVPEVSKYVILPIMEVERIFNSIRFNWLKTILKGKRKPKEEYINAKFNSLFKALAGFPLRNDFNKQRAMKLVANEGFNIEEIPIIDLSIEKIEMTTILRYLFDIFSNDLGRLYKSLLSIKPAFHEWFMDLHHFDFAHLEGLENSPYDDRRTFVLREIHGIRKPSKVKDLNTISFEIRVPSFITYATCAITEGPFVYRKSLDVSYYEQIRKRRRVNLNDNFLIYDYWGKDITEKDLEILKHFQFHNCLDQATLIEENPHA